jgi:phosphinothricin acetyltransferase
MPEGHMIQPLTSVQWTQVRSIYLEGIATGNATFEKSAPDWEHWSKSHLPACRFVAVDEGQVAGWAALSGVSSRCVYAGVAEVSIYVAQNFRRRRIGKALLQEIITASEAQNIWTLQAGIFPENTASIQLHKAAGFRMVGVRERLGYMDGRWRDVVLMERRSLVAGR